ncbi:CHAD domain-containing protein [Nocardioides sp. LML1-1-1.1]|uniref:CHAD domain-containing protein n=1 Tax=Nocardioides sp. LML1-1-1.1 TaxID=3135248 RepID=UPI0034140EC8
MSATAGDLLGSVVADLATGIRRDRPAALADEPDAVHQLRTTVRRLRNLLAAFRRCFDSAGADELGAALASYGSLLGECRDLEVRAADARAALVVLGLTDAWEPTVVAPLERVHAAARARLVAWHAGPDAAALDALLERWVQDPPLRKRARRPAGTTARKAVRRQVRRVLRRAEQGAEHDLRKAARRLRHTADAVASVHPDAAALGRLGHRVQGVLGDARDAQLLAEHARRCGAEPLAAYAEQAAAVARAHLAEPLDALRAKADS